MNISRRTFLLSATSRIAIVAISTSILPATALSAADTSQSSAGERWDLKSMPDMLATAFFQEDVPEGPVSTHKARGILPLEASQANELLQPVKTPKNGILFSGHSNSHLKFPNVKDSLRLYRWCLTITRVTEPGNARSFAQILSVNDGTSAQNCHPKITIDGAAPEKTLTATWHGATEKGTVRAGLKTGGYAAGSPEWNWNLTYRRNGRLFSSLNGTDSGYVNEVITWAWPTVGGGPASIIGGRRSPDINWSYDCIVFGQGELTERMVHKIEGWAAWRAGRQTALPYEHPYRSSPPIVDEEDQNPKYRFDEKAWLDWGDGLRSNEQSSHMGKRVEDRPDFQRVFYDDFKMESVAASNIAAGSAATFFAPGWNSAVGASAQLLPPGNRLELYKQTINNESDGTLTLSLKHQNKWFAPAIYTINDAGQGHSWEGEAIFRLRCRMQTYSKVPGGLFPAFWCYALEPLFVRHLERVEIDFWEFDGKNPWWLNGGSSHVHSAAYPGKLGHLLKDAKRFKVWGGELKADRLGTRKDFTPWDGEWHTWELTTEKELTTLSVSLERDGVEEMVELYRCPTPKEYLERRYVIVNYALRLEDGEPDRNTSHDLDIAYFEVLQKTEYVESFSPPFLKLPVILDVPRVGESLRCDPGLSPDAQDVWYHWYVDGRPRAVSPAPTFTPDIGDLGKDLRCMVKVVGSYGQPQAWSRASAITNTNL